jgi:hypothetical protein
MPSRHLWLRLALIPPEPGYGGVVGGGEIGTIRDPSLARRATISAHDPIEHHVLFKEM